MNEQVLRSLGRLVVDEQLRDAVHIAVVPVVAGEDLWAGTHVGLVDGKLSRKSTHIGVVDPFLTVTVKAGEKCWLFLYPGSITSLSHLWSHPAFDPQDPVGRISKDDHIAKSKAWIAEHADLLGLSADVLMENASAWLDCEEYSVQHGSVRWRDNFNPTEFWHHYEVVTGKVVADDKKHSFYCCTC